MTAPRPSAARVGVADHGGWVILVTVASDGAVVDRRRVELVDDDLPRMPHHNEGQWAYGRYLNAPWARRTSLADVLELIVAVRASAERRAREAFDALEAAVPVRITGIALRTCPPIPASTEARIADLRAQTVADSVMYREVLAGAGAARGWAVHHYERPGVLGEAAAALGVDDVEAFLANLGRSLGPPWQADHKLAAAAAIAAGARAERR